MLVMIAGAYIFEIGFFLQPFGFMMPENFGLFTQPAPTSVKEKLVTLLTPMVEAQRENFVGASCIEQIEETLFSWSWTYWERDRGFVDDDGVVDQR